MDCEPLYNEHSEMLRSTHYELVIPVSGAVSTRWSSGQRWRYCFPPMSSFWGGNPTPDPVLDTPTKVFNNIFSGYTTCEQVQLGTWDGAPSPDWPAFTGASSYQGPGEVMLSSGYPDPNFFGSQYIYGTEGGFQVTRNSDTSADYYNWPVSPPDGASKVGSATLSGPVDFAGEFGGLMSAVMGVNWPASWSVLEFHYSSNIDPGIVNPSLPGQYSGLLVNTGYRPSAPAILSMAAASGWSLDDNGPGMNIFRGQLRYQGWQACPYWIGRWRYGTYPTPGLPNGVQIDFIRSGVLIPGPTGEVVYEVPMVDSSAFPCSTIGPNGLAVTADFYFAAVNVAPRDFWYGNGLGYHEA